MTAPLPFSLGGSLLTVGAGDLLQAHLPVLPVILPLGLAFLVSLALMLAPRTVRPLLALAALGQAASGMAVAVRVFRTGPLLYRLGGWAPPLGIELAVDELSAGFLLIVAIAMPLALVHLLATERTPGRRGLLLCLLAAAAAGWTTTGDLFNLFVFVEIATVACVGLVADRRDGPAAANAFLYLLFASLSATLFLLAIALLYGAAGTLNLAHLAASSATLQPRTIGVVLACLIVSFGIKIGLVPLHLWKPDVYAAAGPAASAVFSGVVMSCAVYGLARVALAATATAGPHRETFSLLLIAAGAVNVLVGHGMAFVQRDLTRLLTFSSVAHAGYILMGFGLGTEAGIAAGLLHTFNHMFMKMGAFYSAGQLGGRRASVSIAHLRGAAHRMPFAFALFFISALALVGVPPSHGFVGKWWLARASLEQGRLAPVLVIAVGTVLSLSYYARFFAVSLRPAPGPRHPRSRPGALAVVAIPVAACLVLGFAIAPLRPHIETAARRLADPGSYVRIVFPEHP